MTSCYLKNLLVSLLQVLLLISIPYSLLAEDKVLKVTVVDYLNREPMKGYYLMILQGDDVVYETKALDTAPLKFSFDYDGSDNYELVISKEGFEPYKFNLSNALSSGKMPSTLRLSLGGGEDSFLFKGRVIDRTTEQPLKGSKITVINNLTGEKAVHFTAQDGLYSINIFPGYEYDIIIQNSNFLKRFLSINYCGDTLKKNNKYCFKGFADISLEPSGGVSSSTTLMDKVVIGKKFKVDNIYYDYNKATLREDGKPSVTKLLRILQDNPQIIVELGSHADSRGSDSYNLSLSQRRAESVVRFILNRGIDASRITPKGYGESQLKNHCKNGVKCTNQEHEINRRTEFIIIDIDESKIEPL